MRCFLNQVSYQLLEKLYEKGKIICFNSPNLKVIDSKPFKITTIRIMQPYRYEIQNFSRQLIDAVLFSSN